MSIVDSFFFFTLFLENGKQILKSKWRKWIKNKELINLGREKNKIKSWLECSPMVWETRVQSQVESYQRLKKWYLMLPCLTLTIIKWGSRVKWSNPGNGVVPSPTLWCSSYWKGSLLVANLTLYCILILFHQKKKKIIVPIFLYYSI